MPGAPQVLKSYGEGWGAALLSAEGPWRETDKTEGTIPERAKDWDHNTEVW